jgi:hypothetical protein
MRRSMMWLAPLAIAAFLTGCGGSSSTNKETKPTQPKTKAPVEIGGGKVASLCKTLCQSIASRCTGDPATEFDAEACVYACTDETDLVLEDADKCVGKSTTCAEAIKCREVFGD